MDNGYELKRKCVEYHPTDGACGDGCLAFKGEVDSKKIRLSSLGRYGYVRISRMGQTCTQIKDYVLEHSGLKASNLYISQIKRKMWD